MTELIEDTQGKIRDLPIAKKLRVILVRAGEEARIQKIRVTSGGQCAIGTCAKRTGSTRHDLGMAADLELWQNERALKFTSEAELPIFKAFVTVATRLGATGVGAGTDYMGERTIHVGFGAKAVWGAQGMPGNAPNWLREAAKDGWAKSSRTISDTYMVVARNGLPVRQGPGPEFGSPLTLEAGTIVSVAGLDGDRKDWARIDLRGDGLIDGHVHRAFLSPIDLTDADSDECQDDCSGDNPDVIK